MSGRPHEKLGFTWTMMLADGHMAHSLSPPLPSSPSTFPLPSPFSILFPSFCSPHSFVHSPSLYTIPSFLPSSSRVLIVTFPTFRFIFLSPCLHFLLLSFSLLPFTSFSVSFPFLPVSLSFRPILFSYSQLLSLYCLYFTFLCYSSCFRLKILHALHIPPSHSVHFLYLLLL